MARNTSEFPVSEGMILKKIHLIRGMKVMIDSDLAELYQVETKRLNEQVRRNLNRFPVDFMFELSKGEWRNLKSQNATSSQWGGRRSPPIAFTEHGVLMLSSVLNSNRAIQVNISIVRVFIRMREMILSSKETLLKLEQIERKLAQHDQEIAVVFKYVKELVRQQTTKKPRTTIGFRTGKKA